MKPVHEMSDEDLNSWVAVKIMEWEEKNPGLCFAPDVLHYMNKDGSNSGFSSYSFSPSSDLNHTHLMEDKIWEIDKWKDYGYILITKLNGSKDIRESIHASARQRCEAAYLTFKEKE